ncbi:hypothetical protein [Legionella israelensis]|uniref:Oligosaccharide repeat unit polymerase n=2 Tax=Legionella israelensis TaxID=454 RepID=A0A0W0WNY8_9GAMM|nr:hypothetical protein [Legionella israelensis]KTD33999.1 hypothetical protein Lisr_0177 [Legionella israelensis]QBS10666.1 hypothetical protein E4T55_12930 [Legionella israelensis]SCX84182.1 hypothetical protein SAMN02746069_00399 [Legionella israelensis DSM 19235]STX57621.1 Uncharacterised protein [Legionella israelensis]
MNYCLNSMAFYFFLPLYMATALLFIFFNVPEEFYFGIFSLLTCVTLPVLFSMLVFPLRMNLNQYYQGIKNRPQYNFIILPFCFFIILFAPLDIYVNGFKWFDPISYSDVQGVGRYIRHVTILCWVLVPVAFLYIHRPVIKIAFILYAILFPIIIVDRNRFFISGYSLFLCLVFTYNSIQSKKLKKISKICFYFLPVAAVLIFSIIGKFRSGNAFMVDSSGTFLAEGYYPLSETFLHLPYLLQQVVIYIATPILNFSTVVAENFINPDFLLSQFSPFSRDNFEAYPFSPILVPRFNVGTEFYPFLLYGGLPLVILAIIFLVLSFNVASLLFKKYPNIFTFLIFIKISYSVLFMGFAPQFFIFLNLMFVVLMMFLWFFSAFIKDSLGHSRTHERIFDGRLRLS